MIVKYYVSKAIDLLYKKGLINIINDNENKCIYYFIIFDKVAHIIKNGKIC